MVPTKKHEYVFSSESEESQVIPQDVSLSLTLFGKTKDTENFNLFVIFDGQIVLDENWQDQLKLYSPKLPLNLNDRQSASLAANSPLILLLRTIVANAKGAKEPDHFLNPDNRAGATIDLIPLVLGEQDIFKEVTLLDIHSGEKTGFIVIVHAHNSGTRTDTRLPLTITMLSAHCLPQVKDDTSYVCAIGLDGLTDPVSVNLGMSHRSHVINKEKTFWASVNGISNAGRSENCISKDDVFIPEDLEPSSQNDCTSVSWNTMTRILVDRENLRNRVKEQFYIEVAGMPRTGKPEFRGRYIGFIDARVLLEPGQLGVTTSAKLLFFHEDEVPERVGALLESSPGSVTSKSKSPSSSKTKTAYQSKYVTDSYGHSSYVVMKFDVSEPLVPATEISALYDILNIPVSDVVTILQDELYVEPSPEEDILNVRQIRKECGALAVHKELSSVACRGQVPMNQGIKRTAANRLMMRVRGLLKQYPPEGEKSSVDWQDTVTAQHAACRRAIAASFEPQLPQTRLSLRYGQAQIAGNKQLSEKLLKMDLEVAPNHPKPLLMKALRYLEAREDNEGRKYLFEALICQPRNRYLLWAYGAQEFNKGKEQLQKAVAALRIAAKGEYSDGCSNAIGWAALHALNHYDNVCYAFVALKRMRKYFELPMYWGNFLKKWEASRGYQEMLWRPASVTADDPFLIASAFFLCLRGYALSELLLHCYEMGCSSRGSRLPRQIKLGPNVDYIRAASLLLRRCYDKALEITETGIRQWGPCAILCQMRTACLLSARGWAAETERALIVADNLGAESSPALLLQAALGGMLTDPKHALQRAARAHKIAPCAYTALAIARIYKKLDKKNLAERWTAAAVNLEPLLADGWAFLAIIALQNGKIDKARALMRTAKQAGEISKDISEEVNLEMNIAHAEGLPETLMNELCFCEYS